jgi:hypothetical protein
VEPSYTRTRDRNYFRFIQVLGVWIHGTPDPWDFNRFILKKASVIPKFRSRQVSLYYTLLQQKRYHSSKFVTLFLRSKNSPYVLHIFHGFFMTFIGHYSCYASILVLIRYI